MVSNQSEPGTVKGPVAPWRGRAASGMRLTPSSMPPPPPFLVQTRTSSWPPPRKGSSFPPPPLPPSFRTGDRDADWNDEDDEKEDVATAVFAEPVTLVTQKAGPVRTGFPEDESTHEIPRETQRRLPTIPPPPGPLPPTGYEVLSASLAAASLAPHGFTVALEQHNALLRQAWSSLPARLPRPSPRVGAGVAVVLAIAVVALSRAPSPGTLVVEARDTTDAPVKEFDVMVDGTKNHCATGPCTLPATRGLHEVQIVGRSFEHPAMQAVSVASGDTTHAHFIVAALRPEVPPPPEPPQAPEPAPEPPSTPVAASTPEPAPAAAPEPAPVAAAEPPPASAHRSAPALTSSRPPVASAKEDRPAEAKATASASAPATSHVASAEAYLNINSMPASSCYLDGRPLGFTPRLHVTTTAGAHTVKFRAADGTTKTVTVSVGAGDTKLAVARLK
jgi:hypothetical protein